MRISRCASASSARGLKPGIAGARANCRTRSTGGSVGSRTASTPALMLIPHAWQGCRAATHGSRLPPIVPPRLLLRLEGQQDERDERSDGGYQIQTGLDDVIPR